MISPVVDQPQGHRGRRLHLPRLLHRPLPGRGDGQVRGQHPEAQEGRDPLRREERLLGRPARLLQRDVQGAGRRDRRRAELQRGRHRTSARSSRHQEPRSPRPSSSPATTPRSGTIARQARELGIKVPLLGGDGWDSPQAVRDRRRGARGLVLLEPLLGGRPEPGHPEVRRRLQGEVTARRPTRWPRSATTRPRCWPTPSSARARPTGPSVRDALAATKDFAGVTGRSRIDDEAQRGEAGGRPEGRRTASSSTSRRSRPSTAPARTPPWRPSSSSSSTGCRWGRSTRLIALGYTMVYGILRLINFAHGDVFMVGAYVGYYLSTRWSRGGAAVVPRGARWCCSAPWSVCAALGRRSSSASPTGRCAARPAHLADHRHRRLAAAARTAASWSSAPTRKFFPLARRRTTSSCWAACGSPPSSSRSSWSPSLVAVLPLRARA